MAMHDGAVADENRALERVLEFANVARPVIGREHVDRRRGYALNHLAVLA